MRLDAHQHFWKLERADYGWLTSELVALYRDFLPGDLAPILERHGIEGTILVQAAPTVAETLFMLDVARQNAFVKGVVGWIDFEAADAPDRIAELACDPKLVGLRPMIQDIADPDWMLQPRFDTVYRVIAANDLVFDALTLPHHLPNLLQLAERHPDLRLVIDHGSKPRIAEGAFTAWAADMTAVARDTTAACKLSGLVTEAGDNWTLDDLRPYVGHILETFGPDRLIWGSDWPVCTLACSYDEWVRITDELLQALDAAGREAIQGGTAARVYLHKHAACPPS